MLEEEQQEEVETTEDDRVTIYTTTEMYWITALASIAGLFSTISSPIYLPAIPVLADYFNTTTEKINLTVTMYSIFQGLSPALWCPLSDSLGRRPVYLICILIYIGANLGLALAQNYATLFVLRCFQSGGIASTIAMGSGVVADFTTRKNRGHFIGIFSGASLIGNAFGPLIGGGISSSLGWRAIFWFLLIAAGVMLTSLGFLMPETNRHFAGNGRVIPSRIVNRSPYIWMRGKIKKEPRIKENELGRPLEKIKIDLMLSLRMFAYWDVIFMLVPVSLHYTTWFMILTSQSTLLDTEYGFSTSQVGFSYLSSGLGGLIGSLVSGKLMTLYYNNNRHKFDNIVKLRLNLAWYPSAAVIAGAIIYGWTIEKHVHYIVPLLSTALVSFSAVFLQNLIQTLLVDLFPDKSASSSACLNLSRCLICACGLAAVDSMVRDVGAGGAFTIMAGICLLTWGLMYCEVRYGYEMYMRRVKIDES